jgi:thiamine pyrophosphokinase
VRGVVITGGLAPPAEIVKRWCESAKVVVAADSGFDTATRAGVCPDAVVGDFDSIENRNAFAVYDGIVERHPRDKDLTDTELGIELLSARGCDEWVILGGGGGRSDHFLGILFLFDRPEAPLVWVTDRAEFSRVEAEHKLEGKPGSVVSVFPIGEDSCTARSQGLKWPLDGIVWRRGDIGVSNELVAPVARITVVSGRLLLVRELEVSS